MAYERRKILQLQKKRLTILNCLDKAKISTITDDLDIDNIENIDQKKE